MDHPFAGFVLVGLMVVLTGWLTLLYQREPDSMIEPVPVLVELWFTAGSFLADVRGYGFADHAQALPAVWVVAGVLTTAIAAGRRPTVIAGAGLGMARYIGWLPFAGETSVGGAGYFSPVRVASWVLLIVTGWMDGYILKKLEHADRSISVYRAREEGARTLHAGVLQTLAVIQRRSDDAELVELARTQEFDLREYLFGAGAAEAEADLAAELRGAACKAEERYGFRIDVICAPDLPPGDEREIHAVSGAVGETLNLCMQTRRAGKAVVYAERFDGLGTAPDLASIGEAGAGGLSVFVSVKDDGTGFGAVRLAVGQGRADRFGVGSPRPEESPKWTVGRGREPMSGCGSNLEEWFQGVRGWSATCGVRVSRVRGCCTDPFRVHVRSPVRHRSPHPPTTRVPEPAPSNRPPILRPIVIII